MSSTIDKIKEAERQLERLRAQAKAEEVEKERAHLEKERENALAQKQREVIQREERIVTLRTAIKKYEDDVQQAQRALSSANSNLHQAKYSLEITLNPPPPIPPKDNSRCSCERIQRSEWEYERIKCSYCIENNY